MGIATLMIIVCHAPASGVALPNVLGRILGLGNFGVDIFLFLSGLGCYYSLSKTTIWADYLKKRYVRIGIPFLLITLPYIILFLLLGEYSLRDAILSLTTLDYWIAHKGAWFVALLIPLYFLSPVIFKVLSGKKMSGGLVLMTVCIIWISNINADKLCCSNIISNIQFVLQRVPSFLIGMAIGKLCKEDCDIKDSRLQIFATGGVILYIVCYFQIRNIFTGWMVILPLILILVKFLDYFPSLSNHLESIGKISLESYLTNIYINHFLCVLIPSRIKHAIFYGRYLEYLIVIVLGLGIAFWVNRVSTRTIASVTNA